MTQPTGLRIIFAGTPDFAAQHLQALIEQGLHHIVAVYTQPDRPAGRGKKLTPSAVKTIALEHHLPVFQPHGLKELSVQDELKQHQADIMIVVAYGLLLPQAVLDIPRFGCFNVHASLLPRWRGAAPIQRAIAAGDKLTGVTIMQMDLGLDTGDMLVKRECDISDDDTAASLHDKLIPLGVEALFDALRELQSSELQAVSQNDAKATYAEKITKEEAQINWSESAATITTKIRAYNPFPIAFTFFNESRIKIYSAEAVESMTGAEPGQILQVSDRGLLVACGEGSALLILQCQLPNKKVMSVADILRGNSNVFSVGACFDRPV